MPKNKKQQRSGRRERRLRVRGELRREPDVRKIASAVIALAMAQAEKDAQLQVEEQVGRSEEQEGDAPPHGSSRVQEGSS